MTSAQEMNVKMAVVRGDKVGEVRKMRLVNATYEVVEGVARGMARGEFSLQYFDEEGDLVTMSSQEEFEEFIASKEGDSETYRIRIALRTRVHRDERRMGSQSHRRHHAEGRNMQARHSHARVCRENDANACNSRRRAHSAPPAELTCNRKHDDARRHQVRSRCAARAASCGRLSHGRKAAGAEATMRHRRRCRGEGRGMMKHSFWTRVLFLRALNRCRTNKRAGSVRHCELRKRQRSECTVTCHGRKAADTEATMHHRRRCRDEGRGMMKRSFWMRVLLSHALSRCRTNKRAGSPMGNCALRKREGKEQVVHRDRSRSCAREGKVTCHRRKAADTEATMRHRRRCRGEGRGMMKHSFWARMMLWHVLNRVGHCAMRKRQGKEQVACRGRSERRCKTPKWEGKMHSERAGRDQLACELRRHCRKGGHKTGCMRMRHANRHHTADGQATDNHCVMKHHRCCVPRALRHLVKDFPTA